MNFEYFSALYVNNVESYITKDGDAQNVKKEKIMEKRSDRLINVLFQFWQPGYFSLLPWFCYDQSIQIIFQLENDVDIWDEALLRNPFFRDTFCLQL